MKNIKNNKTILAVIPAVVVLAAGVAFFCSRSGNTDKQCQETVERLQKLETADISSIEDAIRALSEKEKPTGSDSEEGVLGDILTDVQITGISGNCYCRGLYYRINCRIWFS